MNILLNTLFDKIENAKSYDERKEILNTFTNPRLVEILGHHFNKRDWFLKDEADIPQYNPAKEAEGYAPSTLLHEVRRFYIFKDDFVKVPNDRKGAILANMLESMHAEEAQLLLSILLGTLKVKGLTKKLVSDVFPNIIENEKTKES